MPSNYRGALKVESPSGVRTMRQLRIIEMDALAQLPGSIRFMLNELAVDLAAWKVLAYYHSIARQAAECGGSAYDAEMWTLRKLTQIESADLDAFAAKFEMAHRASLPHKAAAASVLRYGPLGPRGRVRASPLARYGHRRLTLAPEIQEAA